MVYVVCIVLVVVDGFCGVIVIEVEVGVLINVVSSRVVRGRMWGMENFYLWELY